ncbi:hypothetical protein ACHAWF_001423 [Thalassiosira exigua]
MNASPAASPPPPPPSANDTAESTADAASSDRALRVPCYCEENAWRIVYRHRRPPRPRAGDWGRGEDGTEYRVVFASNGRRCLPYFRQRASPRDRPGEYVCWDYHVFVLRTTTTTSRRAAAAAKDGADETANDGATKDGTEVLDVDTHLSYPCPLDDYLDGSFPHALNPLVDPHFLPLFRVVDANEYLTRFYSDRGHMIKDGNWTATPPEYAPILDGAPIRNGLEHEKAGVEAGGCGSRSNLESYVNMSEGGPSEGASTDPQMEGRFGRVYTLEEFRAAFSGRRIR